MSDFDKEAEREKLREKYERDQQKREATEQMSELLLKGATMTNAHCGTCGDPIFRYEGQEFCPTCEEVVTDPDEADAAGNGRSTSTADGPEPTGSDEQTDGQRAAGRSDPAGDGPSAESPASAGTDREGGQQRDDPPETPPSGAASGTTPDPPVDSAAGGHEERRMEDSAGQSPDPTDRGAPGGTTGSTTSSDKTSVSSGQARGTSLADARASLTRTVTRLARQAEASEDLERTRAYLAATEDAADALEAVRRADR